MLLLLLLLLPAGQTCLSNTGCCDPSSVCMEYHSSNAAVSLARIPYNSYCCKTQGSVCLYINGYPTTGGKHCCPKEQQCIVTASSGIRPNPKSLQQRCCEAGDECVADANTAVTGAYVCKPKGQSGCNADQTRCVLKNGTVDCCNQGESCCMHSWQHRCVTYRVDLHSGETQCIADGFRQNKCWQELQQLRPPPLLLMLLTDQSCSSSTGCSTCPRQQQCNVLVGEKPLLQCCKPGESCVESAPGMNVCKPAGQLVCQTTQTKCELTNRTVDCCDRGECFAWLAKTDL
jgi:hypothetical protein